jgi:hypothetical protein
MAKDWHIAYTQSWPEMRRALSITGDIQAEALQPPGANVEKSTQVSDGAGCDGSRGSSSLHNLCMDSYQTYLRSSFFFNLLSVLCELSETQ